MGVRTAAALLSAAAMVIAGCGGGNQAAPAPPPKPPVVTSAAATTTPAPPGESTPSWQVGAHPLPLRPDGFGEVLPTPTALVNRRLPTRDLLPPPADGRYAATVSPVTSNVLARSTWQAACPVSPAQLRYLTMSFWGFDGRPHTGEMLVNTTAADAVTRAFGLLYAARFPIEEMRVTSPEELTAPPTGDGNNTSAFVCRPARGETAWSAHAYGLAVDVDPFCNPYVKGDLVLPELASAYTDRARVRPGMVLPGGDAVRAFASVGWTWGGSWSEPKDIMHFSATGR